MAATLEALRGSGARLAGMKPTPFPGTTADERWPDVVAYYAAVPYLDRGPVDEFVMLAEQLVRTTETGRPEALAELNAAHDALHRGDRAEAGRRAVRCYTMLFRSE